MWIIRVEQKDRVNKYVTQHTFDVWGVGYEKANATRFTTYDLACDFLDNHPSLTSLRSKAVVVRA